MATKYLVAKRMNEDRIYQAGEVVKDTAGLSNVPLLIRRGYLVVVPGDYEAAPPPPPAGSYRPTPPVSEGGSTDTAESLEAAGAAANEPNDNSIPPENKKAAKSDSSESSGNGDDSGSPTGAEAKPVDEVTPGELPAKVDLSEAKA